AAPPDAPPRRRLRNYLIDHRFQLKYTGMVVLVTVLIAGALGAVAYNYSRGQTESLTIQMAMQPELDPEVSRDLEGWAKAQDRRTLLAIIASIGIFALALAVTGIVITHRMVGPAHKLKLLFGDVAQGKMQVQGRLRRHDELQDVFEAFEAMVHSLRQRQRDHLVTLEQALAAAREESVPDSITSRLESLRTAMRVDDGQDEPAQD
ncbi:MAG: hypothetical protein ACPGUV_08175, partial [Polyangiales bacterium]